MTHPLLEKTWGRPVSYPPQTSSCETPSPSLRLLASFGSIVGRKQTLCRICPPPYGSPNNQDRGPDIPGHQDPHGGVVRLGRDPDLGERWRHRCVCQVLRADTEERVHALKICRFTKRRNRETQGQHTLHYAPEAWQDGARCYVRGGETVTFFNAARRAEQEPQQTRAMNPRRPKLLDMLTFLPLLLTEPRAQPSQ